MRRKMSGNETFPGAVYELDHRAAGFIRERLFIAVTACTSSQPPRDSGWESWDFSRAIVWPAMLVYGALKQLGM